jgi:hypothetical protein
MRHHLQRSHCRIARWLLGALIAWFVLLGAGVPFAAAQTGQSPDTAPATTAPVDTAAAQTANPATTSQPFLDPALTTGVSQAIRSLQGELGRGASDADNETFLRTAVQSFGKTILTSGAIGAAIVATGLLSPQLALAALAVSAALLAIAAAGRIFHRWQQLTARDVPALARLLAVPLGVFDIVGVTRIIEGLQRRDLGSGQPLSATDAGDRLGSGLASVALSLLGSRQGKQSSRIGNGTPSSPEVIPDHINLPPMRSANPGALQMPGSPPRPALAPAASSQNGLRSIIPGAITSQRNITITSQTSDNNIVDSLSPGTPQNIPNYRLLYNEAPQIYEQLVRLGHKDDQVIRDLVTSLYNQGLTRNRSNVDTIIRGVTDGSGHVVVLRGGNNVTGLIHIVGRHLTGSIRSDPISSTTFWPKDASVGDIIIATSRAVRYGQRAYDSTTSNFTYTYVHNRFGEIKVIVDGKARNVITSFPTRNFQPDKETRRP